MFILICGLPRAGKTTYSQKYRDKYPIVHLDDCGINPYDGADNRIKRATDSIVVEGVYHRKNRRMKTLLHRKADEEKVCIWLDTPLEVRKRRVGYRRYDEYFEGWDEIIIIRGNYEQRINRQRED